MIMSLIRLAVVLAFVAMVWVAIDKFQQEQGPATWWYRP